MPERVAQSAVLSEAVAPLRPSAKAWRRILRNPRTLSALALIGLMLVLALSANLLAPYSYKEQLRGDELLAPAWPHPLGTDNLGRDLFSRIMYGAQISLAVGLAATAVSLAIGVSVGLISGYLGGTMDVVLMRLTDTVAAFPSLLLAVAITALYEHTSVLTLLMALGVVGWTGMARVVRAEVLGLKTLDYVTAARALGVGRLRIMFRHILPNCLSPIIVMATLAIGGNILGEAGLSFLGLGVPAPFPSWGGMLSEARSYFQAHWWTAVFPGLAIVLTVLAFNMLGDGIRDALDPRKSTLD